MGEQKKLRLELRKNKKGLLGGKGLAKLIIPKLATMAMNLVAIGPRVILRSAFQLLRTNIWTRLISTLVLISFDLYNFARKKISFKQLVINLILSVSLLAGGTIGWMFGTNSVLAVVAENTVLWIIAGIAGAGIVSAVFDAVCRRLLKRFLKSDVDNMLEFINNEFELMAKEKGLSDEQVDEIAKHIQIDDKICIKCFSRADKKKYIRETLIPYFDKEN